MTLAVSDVLPLRFLLLAFAGFVSRDRSLQRWAGSAPGSVRETAPQQLTAGRARSPWGDAGSPDRSWMRTSG